MGLIEGILGLFRREPDLLGYLGAGCCGGSVKEFRRQVRADMDEYLAAGRREEREERERIRRIADSL